MADGEEPRQRKRSVEFLLEGASVRTNRHLQRFARAPYLERLLNDPSCNGLLSRKSQSLRKELSEAYAVLEQLEASIGGHQSAGRELVAVVDLCCGKGFASLILACEFPNAQILGLDFDRRIDRQHAAAATNLHFVHRDIFDHALEGDLATWLADHGARGGVCAAVGMHLCGALSPRAIHLFGAVPALDICIVAPCCLDRRFDGQLKMQAKQLQVDPYCLKVAQIAQLLQLQADQVDIHHDSSLRTNAGRESEGSASVKSALVVGRRSRNVNAGAEGDERDPNGPYLLSTRTTLERPQGLQSL